MRKATIRGVMLAAAMAAAMTAQAKTCVWTGAGQQVSGRLRLFDSANWEGNVTPEDGDTLQITVQSAVPISVNESGHTFSNVIYSSTYGADFGPGDFTLTGTESKFTATGKNIYFGVTLTLAEGSKVEFCQEEGSAFTFKSGAFLGSGEIVVTGTRAAGSSTDQTFGTSSNPNFHGTWSIYRPVWVGSGVNDPFGADDATVNVYGANGEANKAGKLSFAGNSTVSGEINFFDNSSLSMTGNTGALRSIVTFNGNVMYTAENSSYRQLDISVGMNGKAYTSGYVFKKNLECVNTGKSPWMNVYTYSRGTYHFEVRGKFTPTRSSSNPFVMGLLGSFAAEDQLAEVYLGDTVTVGHVYRLAPRSYNHYHTMRANILPTGTHGIWIGFSSRDATTPDSYLDLHGYDQTVAGFDYADNTKVYGFAVQSTGRPATLKVGNRETTAHLVPLLKGKVSIFAPSQSLSTGAHLFTNVYETSGWIGTEKNALKVESTARFPNLGGVECTGAGTVIVSSGAEFNSDMSLDVHDMTGNKVRIATGVNLDVKHVFAENVDLPAGVYCRTGAGVEGATEVTWLNKSSTDTDEMKGTVTVAAHDPVWIWTGGGSSSFTDAANWGANASPDLTNARLTLNLKNAAGKANMVVPLNGTIAPAGAFNCGDYGKDGGAVTFGGAGTLVLGDAGAAETNDLKMVFTESTSFTWNGAGTLYLTGKSTSTGTLTVNSGKVIMDYAGWAGKVVVANGAELAVNTNCGNDVFDSEAELDLDGKLTLGDMTTAGDEIALSVKELYVNGALARHDKPYGSSASAAVVRDDVHFGSTGTIVSTKVGGLMLIFR